MKVVETYVLNRKQYFEIKWLVDAVFKTNYDYIPSNSVGVLKIYKTINNEWYVESPEITWGNTSTRYNCIIQIPNELVNENDLK